MSMVDYNTAYKVTQKQPVAYHKAEPFAPINLKVADTQVLPPSPQQYRPQASPPAMQGHNPYPAYPSPQMLASSFSPTGTQRTMSSGREPVRSVSTSTMSSGMRRSSSTRSGVVATGYVANMRKQKATVWCDRSQPEDRGMLAQLRAAKNRATLDIINSSPHGSVLSHAAGKTKIRHAPKQGTAVRYTPAEMVRGVAPQLSMAEAGEDSDDEGYGQNGYARSGSGRSSITSNRRLTGPLRTADSSSSSLPHKGRPSEGYSPPTSSGAMDGKTTTGLSTGSRNSSLEDESSFGALSQLKTTGPPALQRLSTKDELRRRGSVDDRALAGSGVRLFVANPDSPDD